MLKVSLIYCYFLIVCLQQVVGGETAISNQLRVCELKYSSVALSSNTGSSVIGVVQEHQSYLPNCKKVQYDWLLENSVSNVLWRSRAARAYSRNAKKGGGNAYLDGNSQGPQRFLHLFDGIYCKNQSFGTGSNVQFIKE